MDWIVPEVAKVSAAVYIAVAVAATLLVAISKGGFGGGVGALATPLFVLILPANVALSLLLPLLVVCDLFTIRQFPKEWDPRSFRLIAPGTIIGLAIGFHLLLYFGRAGVNGERWIRLVVASVSLLFCVLQGWKTRRKPVADGSVPGLAVGLVSGVLAGITTMVAHAAGLIITLFFLSQRLNPQRFVGTCGRFYFTFNLTKIPLYVAAGLLADKSYVTLDTLRWGLWLWPLCPIGVALGAWLNRRLSGGVFTFIIYVLLAITAVKMIAGAL